MNATSSASHPLEPVLPAFRNVVRAAVPSAAGFTPEQWWRAEAAVAAALAERPPAVVRQIVLFHRVLNLPALLMRARPFARLSAEDARRVLERLERFPLLAIRRGVWGVRTLAFMAVYTQPEVRERLGYAARPGGWEVRGGVQGPWPERAGAAPPEPHVTALLEEVRQATPGAEEAP